MTVCRICSSELKYAYNRPWRVKTLARQLCDNCNFWWGMVECRINGDVTCDNLPIARINGEHYTICAELPEDSIPRGHNGKSFTIAFFDGRSISTTNLWCQGLIPELFKEQLPNNAEFVQLQQESITIKDAA